MTNEKIITSLRIKRKYLSAEAKIIKAEEQRAKKQKKTGNGSLYQHIYRHRIDVLRPHARSNHLAHCYLIGTPYKMAEPNSKTDPDWKLIEKTLQRFDRSFDIALFEAWKRGQSKTGMAA